MTIYIDDSLSAGGSIVESAALGALTKSSPLEFVVRDKETIRVCRVTGLGTVAADGGTKPTWPVPVSTDAPVYKGTWDGSSNTPTLADGTGTAGWYYPCTVAGTVDFGAGNITFAVGDGVWYNGAIWVKAARYVCEIAFGPAGTSAYHTEAAVPAVAGLTTTGLMGWEMIWDFSTSDFTTPIGTDSSLETKIMIRLSDASTTRTIALQNCTLLNPVVTA